MKRAQKEGEKRALGQEIPQGDCKKKVSARELGPNR